MRGSSIEALVVTVLFAVLPLLSPHASSRDRTNRSLFSIPPLVFVSRNPLPTSDSGNSNAIPGFGPRFRTAIVGGKLMLRKPDGRVHTLVDADQLYDVADPCMSWDAKTIVFSGIVHPDSNWRVYRINIDGDGLVQLTYTDRELELSQFGAAASAFTRYDDFDPCWLPDGRIAFASTRHPSIASVDRVLTSNLYVMNADGLGLHRITSERNGAEEPTIDPLTGRIVFARWWLNVDRPSDATREGLARDDKLALTTDVGNVWHAMSVNPDGNLLKLYAGFPRTRTGMETYKPVVMSDGRLLSTFSSHMSLTQSIGGTGIRWFNPGADYEHYVVGLKSSGNGSHVTQVHAPYGTDPVELSGNRIIFSYSSDGKDYGIYSCTLEGKGPTRILDLPETLELEPQVVKAQRVPPILNDEYPPILSELPPTQDPNSYYINDSFRFDCMNIFANGAVDEPMPDAPRITKGAKIRFFLNSQRQNPATPDPSILIKTVDVYSSGGVHEPDVPADVPMFEQVVDSEGRVLRSPTGGFAHVTGMNYERIGGGTKCVGCHAGHSVLTVPVNATLAEWFNAAPSARVSASSFHVRKDGRAFIPQRVVDRQARTGGDSVIWVSNEKEGSYVLLSWDMPIEVREVILYGVSPARSSGTNIRVQDAVLTLLRDGREVERVNSTGEIRPNGTRVPVPQTEIDAIKITVKKFTGTIYQRRVAGLAEVETIARIP